MTELSPRNSGNLPDKRGETPRVIDKEQRQLFHDLLGVIAGQGRQTLSNSSRRRLAWKPTTINVPFTTEGDELSRLIQKDFMILDGTTFNFRGIPTAVAYGQIANEPNLTLIGGAHYPSTLRDNHINPHRIDRFTAMFGEFPGHFLIPTDYFAFCVAATSQNDLGIVVGDSNPDNRKTLLINKARLNDKIKRTGALLEVANFIGKEMTKKFIKET